MDKKDRYLKVLHSAQNILKDYKIDEIGKMSYPSRKEHKFKLFSIISLARYEMI